MHLTYHKYLKLFIHIVLLIIISESKKAIFLAKTIGVVSKALRNQLEKSYNANLNIIKNNNCNELMN